VGNLALQRHLRGPGTPLDPGLRQRAEARLGASLGSVRLHTDRDADHLARRVNAHAVTDGRSIAFCADAVRGGAPDRTTLGHELVHVAQRRHAPAPHRGGISDRRDPAEAEARLHAASVFAPGPMLAVRASPAAALHRDDPPAQPATQQQHEPDNSDLPKQVPLTDVVAPEGEYQKEDPWELVYNIFRNRGSGELAGMMIRRLIAKRYYEEQGIDPVNEVVDIAMETPPGPTTLPARRVTRFRGYEVDTVGGQITLRALEAALGTSRLETLAGEAGDEARNVGQAAELQAQAAAFAERVPQFATRIRSSFADARLAEVRSFKGQVETARDQARRLADRPPASQFVGGLETTIDDYATTLTAVLGELETWRTQHPRDVTASESAERRSTEALEAQRQMLREGHYFAAGAWGESATANAMSEGLIDLFGGRTQRDIAEAYDRGEVSFNEMEDLQYCAAVRSAVVGVVTVAVAVATAGLGGAIVGGLGLAAEGTLTYAVLGAGLEGGFGSLTMMGTEHFLTSQVDFSNPAAQSIWGRGAYTPTQYLEGFGTGFAFGGAFGAGGHFLFPGSAAGSTSFALSRPGTSAATAEGDVGALLLSGERSLAGTGERTLVGPTLPGSGQPLFEVLSVVEDATYGTRTAYVRLANGELLTVVGHPETGMGYLLRANGEMYNIVDGQVAGRTQGLLGPGGTEAAAPVYNPPAVFEGPGGNTIRLPGRTERPQLPGRPIYPQLPAGGYRPQLPTEAMQLWGDPRWAEYGGNWTMRDAATGQRMQIWQIDELMAAERRGALPGETQVRYPLGTPETFTGRPGPQLEVIPDIARTGRLGPLPREGAVFTEVKHRAFADPGFLGQTHALDAAGSLQRMYRAAGIEAQINPAAAGATLEVVTNQALSAETHNLIVREFARWLRAQGLTNAEILEQLGRIRWSTQRPFQIRGGTVVREPP
jgi:hypothetical protein